MIETDYVWLKPVAAPLAESSEPSLAFPFGYIQPTAGGISKVMRKMYPAERGPLSDVPNSGPAPVLMRWQELFKVLLCSSAPTVSDPYLGCRLLARSLASCAGPDPLEMRLGFLPCLQANRNLQLWHRARLML